MKKTSLLLAALVLLAMGFSSTFAQKPSGGVDCWQSSYFTIYALQNASVDLGYLNPDGARMLSNADAIYFKLVTSKRGLPFSANGSFHSMNWSQDVYMIHNKWFFKDRDNTDWTEIMFTNNIEGNFEYSPFYTNYWGCAEFKFLPGMIVARETATAGSYSFQVHIKVETRQL